MISDPYFSTKRCVDRLKAAWVEHGQIIVGFDFDDTIYDYHKKGYKYTKVINLLKRCREAGAKIIMCSVCKSYDEAVKKAIHVKGLGITENVQIVRPEDSKPFVNIMLDDKAGLGQAYEILNTVVKEYEKNYKKGWAFKKTIDQPVMYGLNLEKHISKTVWGG